MPIVLLDSWPLSLLSNPRHKRDPLQCKVWAKNLLRNDIPVLIPGIVDYELRRELTLNKENESLLELDRIRQAMPYLPVTDKVLKRAADLWAWARITNQQTSSTNQIDADAILSAQAILLAEENGEYVIIATSNVKHIERYTPAKLWKEITVEYCFNPKSPAVAVASVST